MEFKDEGIIRVGAGERRRSYKVAGYSRNALAESPNQDRMLIAGEGFVLCDGMGGLSAGEVFAQLACWRCRDSLRRGLGADESLASADEALAATASALDVDGGSAGCVVRFRGDGGFEIGLRGDIAACVIDADEVEAFEGKPCFLGRGGGRGDEGPGDGVGGDGPRAFGRASPDASVVAACRALRDSGERLIVMSDGVWRSLSRGDIKSVCESVQGDSTVLARQLVEKALAYGSTDDCTCIVCSLAGESRSTPLNGREKGGFHADEAMVS